MLLRLVCRNGLHKQDFWEIIKSKIRHSFEAHTYLRHIRFARLFQRIECLLVEIEQTARPLETNAHANFPWQRTQHINVWRMVWGNMPTLRSLWLTVRVMYNVETK